MTSKRRKDGDESKERLRAYDGKDYGEIIEFPVELVDRDGVVRRYSYEESLAVYHRRIQSAPWRYGDDDLVRAEIGHCTRRIDQIKRSYSSRSRSGLAEPAPDPQASLGEAWGLLRGFYDRVLADHGLRPKGELVLAISLLQDEPASRVYHIAFDGARDGHLLYVFPFDRQGDADPQAAWRDAQVPYRGLPAGLDVERLLLAEAGEGLGVVVTGTSELPEGLRAQAVAREEVEAPGGIGPTEEEARTWWNQAVHEDAEAAAGDPFEAGVTALREDRPQDAIDAFRRVVEANPFHREAYLALLAVLDGAGRYAEADLYGEMAGRHLPGDGLVRYRQAINMVRQGKLERAIAAFDEAAQLAPSLFQPSYFAAQVLVVKCRDLDGAARRLKSAAAVAEDEPHVLHALRSVQRCIALRRSLRLSSIGLAGISGALVATGELLASIGLVVAASCALLSGPVARTLARWLLRTDTAT